MDPERFRVKQQLNDLPSAPLDDLPPPPPPSYGVPKKAKKSKWWVWVVLLIVIVLGLGAWAYKSYKTPTKKAIATKQATIQTKPAAPIPAAPSIPTSSHTSSAYGLTFNYPTSWSVVDSGSAPLLVTSPVISLTSDSGQLVNAEVMMTISKPNLLPPGFTSSSVAVLASQKIAYTKPAPTQAADTYLSFVQYPATNIRGGLDGIYVSGNYGYQMDQVIPAANIDQINPTIYFSFYACASSTCPISTRQLMTISINEWNLASFKEPILLILKSLYFG